MSSPYGSPSTNARMGILKIDTFFPIRSSAEHSGYLLTYPAGHPRGTWPDGGWQYQGILCPARKLCLINYTNLELQTVIKSPLPGISSWSVSLMRQSVWNTALLWDSEWEIPKSKGTSLRPFQWSEPSQRHHPLQMTGCPLQREWEYPKVTNECGSIKRETTSRRYRLAVCTRR